MADAWRRTADGTARLVPDRPDLPSVWPATDTVDRVSLVAAAVCPHPPLIVPEVAAGAAPELDDLRAACDAAVAGLLATRPDRLITVGTGPKTLAVNAAYGSFAPYGVRTPATGFGAAREPDGKLSGAAREPDGKLGGAARDLSSPRFASPRDRSAASGLPLSLTVGAWLLERAGANAGGAGPGNGVISVGQAVAGTLPSAECAALGERLAATGERVALLVMGDGSACRGDKAPGYADPRAEPYDDAVATALRDADADALLSLDERLSTELMVAGRAAWQVLAGAAQASQVPWHGVLSHAAAPYGVAYFVATWEPAETAALSATPKSGALPGPVENGEPAT
jgi:hypothetical protein